MIDINQYLPPASAVTPPGCQWVTLYALSDGQKICGAVARFDDGWTVYKPDLTIVHKGVSDERFAAACAAGMRVGKDQP